MPTEAQIKKYREQNLKTMGKVKKAWNAQQRSVVHSSTIRKEQNHLFAVPNKVRWNAFFDGLLQICNDHLKKVTDPNLRKNPETRYPGLKKLNSLLGKIGITLENQFTPQDVDFIWEYVQVCIFSILQKHVLCHKMLSDTLTSLIFC